ncbi:MAG: hypothetical protein ACE5IK_10245, partial [Acidobacteriota bacterium]
LPAPPPAPMSVEPVSRPGLPAAFHRQMAGSEAWVLTAGGALPGVVALPSIHLQGGRSGFPPPAAPASLYVDTGATRPGENGTAILDRVVARVTPQILPPGAVTGVGIGRRAALAAALVASRRPAGVAALVLAAQSRFLHRGLVATGPALAAWAAGGGIVLVDPADTGGAFEIAPAIPAGADAADDPAMEQVRQVAERLSAPESTIPIHVVGPVPVPSGLPAVAAAVTLVRVPVVRLDTLAETVSPDVVRSLARLMRRVRPRRRARGIDAPGPDAPAWRTPARLFPADGRRPFAHMPALIQTAGVSGHETAVRDVVRRMLPHRFDDDLEEDPSGNLVLDIGHGSPHLLFVAHLDETGYRVTGIDAGGRLTVERRGGFYDSAVVDRPVHVHTASGVVPGVLVRAREPAGTEGAGGSNPAPLPLVERIDAATLRVDVATTDPEDTAALGIAVGDPVTVPKQFRGLGAHRGYGRAVDDRAGSAVLIAALHRLALSSHPASPDRIVPPGFLGKDARPAAGRLTFAWVTREEVGLEGSRELASRLAVDTVFAVDTFVSADSPLENARFGLALLGAGAVLRAVDTSSLAPLDIVRTVLAGAVAANIPVQTGVGRGGNDGSVFVGQDAPDLPLSWPGRYSHSAIEVIDERDQEALVDLVLWLAVHPEATAAGS